MSPFWALFEIAFCDSAQSKEFMHNMVSAIFCPLLNAIESPPSAGRRHVVLLRLPHVGLATAAAAAALRARRLPRRLPGLRARRTGKSRVQAIPCSSALSCGTKNWVICGGGCQWAQKVKPSGLCRFQPRNGTFRVVFQTSLLKLDWRELSKLSFEYNRKNFIFTNRN